MTGTELTRRNALRATGGIALGLLGAGTAATRRATAATGWFSNVSNYDGVVDRTGKSEVTVEVGVEANGGGFGFGPAAVRVDPGTTVVWKWTGKGGSHNVEAKDGSFESKMTDEAGFTFEQTFESKGVTKYYCMPHQAMGMKGAVLVGDAATVASVAGNERESENGSGNGKNGAGGTGGEGTSRSSDGADGGTDDRLMAKALVVGLGMAILSPLGFMFVDSAAGEEDR